METDYEEQSIEDVKALLEENGESLEDLGWTENTVVHMLKEGF